MDEGTDYAREYFDNGENYLDEDDGDDGEAVFWVFFLLKPLSNTFDPPPKKDIRITNLLIN